MVSVRTCQPRNFENDYVSERRATALRDTACQIAHAPANKPYDRKTFVATKEHRTATTHVSEIHNEISCAWKAEPLYSNRARRVRFCAFLFGPLHS
jgi:hypothetical protein